MFGGGGLNPRKMQQMMEQMGIEMDELDAESVVISLMDGTELVFEDPDVTKMEAKGQETYQIVGEPVERSGMNDADTADETDSVPEGDVELVVERTGVDADTAREALEDANGDIAAAISQLE